MDFLVSKPQRCVVLAQLMASALLLGLTGIWIGGHFPPWQEPCEEQTQAELEVRADLPGCSDLSPAELSRFGCYCHFISKNPRSQVQD